jgi:hypothetical protein
MCGMRRDHELDIVVYVTWKNEFRDPVNDQAVRVLPLFARKA